MKLAFTPLSITLALAAGIRHLPSESRWNGLSRGGTGEVRDVLGQPVGRHHRPVTLIAGFVLDGWASQPPAHTFIVGRRARGTGICPFGVAIEE